MKQKKRRRRIVVDNEMPLHDDVSIEERQIFIQDAMDKAIRRTAQLFIILKNAGYFNNGKRK